MNLDKTLTVDLGERSYPIYIGSGLLKLADLIAPHISGRKTIVVSNTTVAPLYLDTLLRQLSEFDTASLILPDGEEHKSLDTLNTIYTTLLEKRFDRNCTLIALGGGVVGDITGFAAASYQRGVSFVQVPTTLLAQVDSSVGGKTGVNHALGKNMIGAFHQPRCVIADTDTLSTLSDDHLRAGLAEVIKYGAIDSIEFFDWLESNIDSLLCRDSKALIYAIEQSCRHKARIVAADELEQGKRALLNLGHTFGHAIETATGYGTWLHGHAVAAGMCMAASLSVNLGWMVTDERDRFVSLIQKTGLPTAPPTGMTTDQFLELMSLDKKVRDGALNLILMKGLGKSLVTSDYSRDCLVATLSEYCS